MHPLENQLIQLQELTLIKDEQRMAPNSEHLVQLDASIKQMTAELPRDLATLFEKLQKKDHIVIVPVSDGNCAGCGMKLAISHVQAVRLAREINSCPNCARMLYYPEQAAKRVGKRPSRLAPVKPGISRFSSHTLMMPKLEAKDAEGAIREMALKMQQEGFIDQAEKLVEPALRREAIVSTALDHGLAFPHVRGIEGGGLTIALGISKDGIRFADHTKNLTKIVFFTMIPTAASAFYLKILSGLAQTFMNADARKALLAEKTDEGLWKTLVKVTRTTIK